MNRCGCVYVGSKEDIINIIQEGIDAIIGSNAHMLTTYDEGEIRYAFNQMADWYREEYDDE